MNARPSSNAELAIIVVSYGTREMTLECLDSVVRETHETSYTVRIVDNASLDGSAEAIATRFPDFQVMTQHRNLGFAAACNLAVCSANERYLLFLNPDTVILDGALDRLMAFARKRAAAGIWGGRTVFADGTLNPTSCWRRPTLWNLFCSGLALDSLFPNSSVFRSLGYGGWRRDTERSVDVVSGCFLLIDRFLWERLDGFATEFFMYGEDADLCLRARRLGVRPVVTPDATIVHHGSGTEMDKVRKMKQVLAAKALLIRRHFSPVARPFGLALLALRPWLARKFANAALRGIWQDIWAFRRQWLAGEF